VDGSYQRSTTPVTREIFVRDFRLMYEVSGDRVHVVALMYGARDFETWRREREHR